MLRIPHSAGWGSVRAGQCFDWGNTEFLFVVFFSFEYCQPYFYTVPIPP